MDRDGYLPDGTVAREFAARDLGLDWEESARLFYPIQWPNKEGSTYRATVAEDRENFTKFPNTPKGAAKRIRYFIKEGK